MSDLISREAAIDALESGKDKTAKGDIGRFYNAIIQNDIDKLRNLPSAQPEREERREDAVSRNAIIQKLNTMDRYVSEELRLCDTDKKFPKNEVFIVDDVYEEIVENMPSVQPKAYLIGCLYAVNELIEKGSFAYSVKVDGRFETVPWAEVKGWVEKQCGINQEDSDG